MREILFHGKRLDNGEWIEGTPFHRKSFYGSPDDRHFMLTGEEFHYDYYEAHEVDPATVGQFTGRSDAHDKRIFEGHIVRFYRTNSLGRTYIRVGRVAFDTYNGTPAFCVIDPTGYRWSFAALGEVEIIGNIHDNPELLEKEDDHG